MNSFRSRLTLAFALVALLPLVLALLLFSRRIQASVREQADDRLAAVLLIGMAIVVGLVLTLSVLLVEKERRADLQAATQAASLAAQAAVPPAPAAAPAAARAGCGGRRRHRAAPPP